MLEFARYLKENFNEDTSTSEKIIKERWNKVVDIIKEAFDDQFADKRTALHKIQNEFVDKRIAPSSIDVDFLKENMQYVIDKINSLDEGEIRITINNDVDKKSSGLGMESTGKRGRPKKVVEEEAEEVGEDEEKTVKVSIDGTKVVVEPSANTGLEKSEHDFDSEDDASGFADSLKELFAGYNVEIDEKEAEEEVAPQAFAKLATEAEELDGEEPEDAGEEPEDAGEEPEDAGEEPEDAGEEQEDSIDWGDIADLGGEDEEAEEEMMGNEYLSLDLENLDLKKLIGTLIRVDENWYHVKSITEDNTIVVVNKDKKESTIGIDEIDEMEYSTDDAEECMNAPAEEEVDGNEIEKHNQKGYKYYVVINGKILTGWEYQEDAIDDQKENKENLPDANIKVYGISKLKSMNLDPDNNDSWGNAYAEEEVTDFSGDAEIDDAEECMNAPAEEEVPKDELELEGFKFAKTANRYMEEDILTPPSMVDTTGGLTKNPSAPPKKMEKTNTPEKMATKAGPSASLTAKPGKPPKKSEKVGSVPKSDKKAAPSASLTSKPSKPKEKVEKVKSPDIPAEYKKGGAKG